MLVREYGAAVPGFTGTATRGTRDQAFAPDLVMVPAGFDAHAADPLAAPRLTTADFAWATTELARIADQACAGRLVSTLEGGYDMAALASSAAAHVKALMVA